MKLFIIFAPRSISSHPEEKQISCTIAQTMIRLKKKAEEKAAAASTEESMASAATSGAGAAMEVDDESQPSSATSTEAAQFKLLGIGGKTIHTGEVKTSGKKKTPGEIRIQKGQLFPSSSGTSIPYRIDALSAVQIP